MKILFVAVLFMFQGSTEANTWFTPSFIPKPVAGAPAQTPAIQYYGKQHGTPKDTCGILNYDPTSQVFTWRGHRSDPDKVEMGREADEKTAKAAVEKFCNTK